MDVNTRPKANNSSSNSERYLKFSLFKASSSLASLHESTITKRETGSVTNLIIALTLIYVLVLGTYGVVCWQCARYDSGALIP